jgi:hypothetical protein
LREIPEVFNVISHTLAGAIRLVEHEKASAER